MPPDAPAACAHCRYDLRGVERGRCPECGQPLTPAALAVARERRFLRCLTITLVPLGVIGLVVAGAAAALLPDRPMILVPLFGVIMAMGAVPVLAAVLGDRVLRDR